MEPANSDIKVFHVTGDAAAYIEPKKRTRRSRRKQEGGDLFSDITSAAESAAESAASAISKVTSAEPPAPAPAPTPAPAPVPTPAANTRVVPYKGGAPVVKLVPKITKVSNIAKKPSIPLTRKKRTFKAKKVSVMIAEADPKTRKARNTIAKKVAAMSVDELRKELETNGLMKKGKKQIPEEMLRSMMRDALTLSEGK